MNEELDSQLSAMFDDELPPAECELLARRLARDEALKARWRRYAIIGAALRAERGVRLETNLAPRISAAISAEPPLAAPAVAASGMGGTGRRWVQPIAGAGIAAAVATVAILWMRAESSQELIAQNPAASSPTQVIATEPESQPETYVVPAAAERPVFVAPSELANYVVAHSEFTTPLSRRSLLSALMASDGTGAGSGESEDVFEDPEGDAEQAQ